MGYRGVTVNISFLILLLSIFLSTQAGERLQVISGSMAKTNNPFSKLFDDGLENEDIDTTDKRQPEEITLETKLDAAQIKEGEQHNGIKDGSANFAPEQQKEPANVLSEIDIISDINAQFADTINKLQVSEVNPKKKMAHKKPTQLFNNDSVAIHTTDKTSQATNKNINHHASKQTGTIQAANDNCVKEKVYTLDVANASRYERLEDFPFTYECVIQR
jgi:hypothetical protein